MFLRVLNDEQKRALVVIAHHLVVSDQSISQKEGALLDELLIGLRTTIPVSPKQLYAKPDLAVFGTREARVVVMLELLTLAFGDNVVPAAESKLMHKLSFDLGFSAGEYKQMELWAEKNAALLDEALSFVNGS